MDLFKILDRKERREVKNLGLWFHYLLLHNNRFEPIKSFACTERPVLRLAVSQQKTLSFILAVFFF